MKKDKKRVNFTEFRNKNSSESSLSEKLGKLQFDRLLMAFDSNSFPPNALAAVSSLHLESETGFVFYRKNLIDDLAGSTSNETFTKISSILAMETFNPENIHCQRVPIKTKVLNETEVKILQIGKMKNTQTIVVRQQIDKIASKSFQNIGETC